MSRSFVLLSTADSFVQRLALRHVALVRFVLADIVLDKGEELADFVQLFVLRHIALVLLFLAFLVLDKGVGQFPKAHAPKDFTDESC